jgi:hypothetical protein
MNLKAIIASLVLGSSSLAAASPSVTFSASAHGSYGTGSYGTTVVRDRLDPDCDPATGLPYARPIAQPVDYREGGVWRGHWQRPVSRPVLLASDMHFAGDGRTFIKVGPQQGRFSTLQISAARGRTFITQVYIEFDNGQEQVIRNLDRTLVGNQTLTLDLDGNRRGIARVVVYGSEMLHGWRRSNGSFNVFAS